MRSRLVSMRSRLVMAVSTAAVVVGAVLVTVPAAAALMERGEPTAGADPVNQTLSHDGIQAVPPPPSTARLTPGPVEIDSDDFWSWALLDLSTGEITGADNYAKTSTTASMIKVWLAADYLREATDRGERPAANRISGISAMIRDSENDPATELYEKLGGAESIDRLIDLCGLTDSAASWRWSLTELSARDAVRMAGCLADGRAAGPDWTDWLLREMRLVRGLSDFGIRAAFEPEAAARVSIKNGYFARPEDGNWHLNCLAIGEDWALAVLQRYPEELGLAHGATICRQVAQQLRVP